MRKDPGGWLHVCRWVTEGTYVAEFQGKVLCGLQLGSAQVHVPAGGPQRLREGRLLLGLEHGRRQDEMKGAAGVFCLTHVHGALARHFLGAGTGFEEHLVAVLADV